MSSRVPRPFLLALILVLVPGAIAFIELRLDAARPVSADAQRNSGPPAAEEPAKAEPTTVEQTSDTATSKQRDAAPPSARETEDPSSRERAESGRPDRAIADAERLAKKEDEHRQAGEIVAPAGVVNADGFSVREAAGEKVV